MRHFWVFLAVGVAVFSEGRSEDNSWEGIAEAKMYLKEGNLQQSLRSATQVIYRDPTNCHALKLRGNVHCLLENYESAIQDFDVVILLAPRPQPLSIGLSLISLSKITRKPFKISIMP